MARPVTRESNPSDRGVANPGAHQTAFERFQAFCKKTHKRTVHEKGVRIGLVGEFMDYSRLDPLLAMTYRLQDDPSWGRTMEDHIRDKFPDFIQGYAFDENYTKYMSMSALNRLQHPLCLGMNQAARARMNAGRQQLVAEYEPSDLPQDTAPNRFHEDYESFAPAPKAPPTSSSSSSAPPKGGGTGKQPQVWGDGNWHGWSNRQW